MKLSKKELIKKLNEISEVGLGDTEDNHIAADVALLDYIDDPEIRQAYNRIEKWYA